MKSLSPWVRGPFELLQHAEEHYIKDSDLDRRIALIGFDNTIESTITTYLQLHPQLRKDKEYPKDDIQKWLRSYHSKVKFVFEIFLDNKSNMLDVSINEVIWYHNLRNELYHSGNGVVPAMHCLEGVRNAAIEIMQLLFDVDVRAVLNSIKQIVSIPETKNISTPKNLFLQSYIALERTILGTAIAIGADQEYYKSENIFVIWRAIKEQIGDNATEHEVLFKKAIKIRNEIINNRKIIYSDPEIQDLTNKIDNLVNFLQTYGFSFNILKTLKQRYGDWVDPNISFVRIIQKDRSCFLEVSKVKRYNYDLYDENLIRINLDFIASDNFDEPLFSTVYSAQYNSERFFDELDLYSIVMTGIGDVLFSQEGVDAAAKFCGADCGEPLGNITSR